MAEPTDSPFDHRGYIVRVREVIEYEIRVPIGKVTTREEAVRWAISRLDLKRKPRGKRLRITGYPHWKNR